MKTYVCQFALIALLMAAQTSTVMASGTPDATSVGTIPIPPPKIVYPNGGETFTMGQTVTIRWTQPLEIHPFLGKKLMLRHLMKAGYKDYQISPVIPWPTQSYIWTVPEVCGAPSAPTGSRFKMVLVTADGGYLDSGDATFTIRAPATTNPTLQLLAPNGTPDVYGVCKPPRISIQWNADISRIHPYVRLDLYKKLSCSEYGFVGTIAEDVPSLLKEYDWDGMLMGEDTATIGCDFKIAIISEDDEYEDWSDYPFCILQTFPTN